MGLRHLVTAICAHLHNLVGKYLIQCYTTELYTHVYMYFTRCVILGKSLFQKKTYSEKKNRYLRITMTLRSIRRIR